MIGVITDTVTNKDLLEDLRNYRLIFFLNTKKRATRLYSQARKMVMQLEEINFIEVKLNVSDRQLIEKVALGLAREFAEYKEKIEIWVDDKCIVY